MSEVYEPAEDTYLLAEVLSRQDVEGKNVLEIGCGSGYIAKSLAQSCANVTAVDISPAAVEATKKTLEENKLGGSVFLSDLFSNIVGAFDIIVFNPPYLPEDEYDEIVGSDARYSGGASGRMVIERFVEGAKAHLSERGKVFLVISSLTGEREVFGLLEKKGFLVEVKARKKIEWEELVVLEAKVQS